ncbi:MazG-like protein [Veillonella atypica]|uniref:MazG-like protein n=1 Tax=Veillonella atypica TaxID=39777 RepID=UPI0023B13FB8|nr:MazG-like protein [Veillonella atypica]MDE8714466.1 MazG-like protein [Veillonella atypica]
MDLKEVKLLSKEIRNKYFELEKEIHGSVWSVEEDALAFLTDAGLVGRLTMDNQGRWPSTDKELLPSKIGECIWWLAILAERMDLSFEECVETFLTERLKNLK